MRRHICHIAFTFAAAVALLGGESAAQAQTVITGDDQPVETVVAPMPGEMVIAQEPMVGVPPATVVESPAAAVVTPMETVQTVRTVRTTTAPRRHYVSRVAHRRRVSARVTTTRTIISERVVPAPAVVATTPLYDVAPAAQPVIAPPPAYAPLLYDVATTPLLPPQPPAFGVPVGAIPAYHYVYEPDRILVVNAAGVAVQSLPR